METFRFNDGNVVFFTSDTHFGHNGILNYCNRGYNNIDEMNAGLIEKWNSVVGKDDFIFHLGDFAFGGSELWLNTLRALNGNKILILGNHDIKNFRKPYENMFQYVGGEAFIIIEDQQIYLNHFPYLTYNGVFREKPIWQLFGHVHTNQNISDNIGRDFFRLKFLLPSQYEVGCDLHDGYPISYNFIKERINYQVENNVNMLHWLK